MNHPSSTRFSSWLRLVFGLALLLGLCAVTGGLTRPAHAQTRLSVTNCSSDAQLQADVAQANHDNAGDIITFACSGDLKLTSTLTISGSMTLSGSGRQVALDGGDSLQVLHVNPGASLTLKALAIVHGLAASDDYAGTVVGGGLKNEGGTVTISNSIFAYNSAPTGQGGPLGSGLYNSGANTGYNATVTISNSIFANNSAFGGSGSGLFNDFTDTVSISNSIFANNSVPGGSAQGGGIFNLGTLTVTNSTFSGNSANADGGAIENFDGTLSISSSTFSANSSASGGAIDNYGSTVSISSSTFANNSASNLGGGLSSYGALSISNSTFSGNTAGAGGGAIYNDQAYGLQPSSITNSTIANNSAPSGQGGGIFNNFPTLSISGSIVAANSGGNCANYQGPLTSGGYNLESGTECGFTGTGDLQNSNPKLGPLASNGGPTQTLALLKGSPAIDVIPLTSGLCPPTDQRGHKRPDGSTESACDIGAFES